MKLRNVLFTTLCIAMLMSFLILMISAASNITLNTSSDAIVKLPVVVVDAGHGGEDGGAVNDDGVLEKDINLSISLDTADLLNFLGFDVVQTRTDDTALSGDEATVHERKVADLNKRLEIFNSSENNVVISIHQNKFTQSQYSGTQIFYSPNNENSSKLAESIKYSVKGLLQPDNERVCKEADSGIYLLNNATIPAVIVECGFISNPEECAKLLDTDYQKQMSYAIAAGFLNYINT